MLLRCTQLLCLLLLAAPAGADPVSLGELPAVAALQPERRLTPLRTDAARARILWDQSQRLENADDFIGAAELRARVAELRPQDAHVRWRIARDLLHGVTSLPPSDREARMQTFETARDWAREGSALDTHCGECCLYDFASTAQLATAGGLASRVGHVREARETLERCLAIPPTWSEPRWGHERGQLYYGAAAFYRMLPGGAWARWVLGMRGDPERAVDLARRATLVSPEKPAYRVELGAALLCHASRSGDRAAGAEGRRLLTVVETHAAADTPERVRAAGLLAAPDHSCDDSEHYGRVSWR